MDELGLIFQLDFNEDRGQVSRAIMLEGNPMNLKINIKKEPQNF